MKLSIISVTLFVMFLSALPVFAQTPQIPEPQDFGKLIQDIFGWAMALVGAAVFVNFLWAGFLWFTAAGRAGPIGQAKEKMTKGLIGAIILLASFLILKTINPDLVKQTFPLPGLKQSERQGQQNFRSSSNQNQNSGLSAGGDIDDTAIYEAINDILYADNIKTAIEEKAGPAGLIVGHLIPNNPGDPEAYVLRHPKTKKTLLASVINTLVVNAGLETSKNCGFFWEPQCGGFDGSGGGLPIVPDYDRGGGGSSGPRGGGPTVPKEFQNTVAICRDGDSDNKVLVFGGKTYSITKPVNKISISGDIDTGLYKLTEMIAKDTVDSLNSQFRSFRNPPRFELSQQDGNQGDITIRIIEGKMSDIAENLSGMAIYGSAYINGDIYEHSTILLNGPLIEIFLRKDPLILDKILIHEFGHLFGLAHNLKNQNSIMTPNLNNYKNEAKERGILPEFLDSELLTLEKVLDGSATFTECLNLLAL